MLENQNKGDLIRLNHQLSQLQVKGNSNLIYAKDLQPQINSMRNFLKVLLLSADSISSALLVGVWSQKEKPFSNVLSN